jgi:hypothetical protein
MQRDITVIASAVALAMLSPACVPDDEVTELAEETRPIVGQQTTLRPSIAQVVHQTGSLRSLHAYFVLTPELLVGPRTHIAGSHFSHRYVWEGGPGLSDSGTASFDNDSTDYFPGVTMLQIDPLPAGTLPGVSMLTPAQLSGQTLDCFNYAHIGPNTWQLQRVQVTVDSATASTVAVRSVNNAFHLTVGDLGAPCVRTADSALVGLVRTVDAPARTAVLTRAAHPSFQAWIAGIQNLMQVRTDFRTEGPYRIEYRPQAGNSQRMCIDVPSASPLDHVLLQQYPCHDGDNQKWYIDHRATDPGRPRFVSASTGRCIDVPNFSPNPGVQLQQYRCQDVDAQKFLEQPASGGTTHLKPKPGLAGDLCLSVTNGPSFSARRIEQRSCWYDPLSRDQRWTFAPTQP